MAACNNTDLSATITLLQAGADTNVCNQSGLTALHLAAGNNDHPNVMETLLQRSADAKSRDERGKMAPGVRKKNPPLVNPVFIGNRMTGNMNQQYPETLGSFIMMHQYTV